MTNSLTADGLSLDTLAQWVGVKSNRWAVPGVKGENVAVPARHGSLWVADKTFAEGEFTLEIIVQGATDQGLVSIDQLGQVRENIDRLLRIFTRRKRLIHFTAELEDGTPVECEAECVGAFDVTRESAALPFARMTLAFKVPAAFWHDVEVRQWTSSGNLSNSQVLRMAPFEGGTAPMDDLAFLVHGPISDPELRVYATGAFTRFNGLVPAGSTWRVNAADWSSVMGPGVTFYSTNDPQAIAKTVHGGSASLMDFPALDPFEYAIELGGANIGAGCFIEARGRRKHLIS